MPLDFAFTLPPRPQVNYEKTRTDSAIFVERPNKKSPKEIAIELAGKELTNELIEYWNYPCEKHVVKTCDGWNLDVFRIPYSNFAPVALKNKPHYGTPVILWHGLSTTSSIFVCNVNATNNLAFYLSDLGFDVWLANNRGNMYTSHTVYKREDKEFWDFCIDDLANDPVAVVDYIREKTGYEKVCYVGFSQGTAQLFAALSINEELNDKIAFFGALGPAIKPQGLKSPPLNALLNITPNSIYTVFGKGSFMNIATTLRSYVSSTLYSRIIGTAVDVLFQWKGETFEEDHKISIYNHVFGVSSTKNYVHWFQIISSGRFQRYNPCPSLSTTQSVKRNLLQHFSANITVNEPSLKSNGNANTITDTPEEDNVADTRPVVSYNRLKTEIYPTWKIKTPTALFWGSKDLMTDIQYFTKYVGGIVHNQEIEDFDHLDFLYSKKARGLFWGNLVDLLVKYSDEQQHK